VVKYVSPKVIAKVKAIAVAVAIAAGLAGLQVLADMDWTGFAGPFAPVIGAVIALAVGYLKRPAAGDAPVEKQV
jgi:hypothetical protein